MCLVPTHNNYDDVVGYGLLNHLIGRDTCPAVGHVKQYNESTKHLASRELGI